MAFFNWHGILLCCNFKSNIIYLFLLCQIKVTTQLLHYYFKIILSVIVANNNFFIPTTSIYVCKSLVNLVSKGTIIYFYDGTSPVRHKRNLCIQQVVLVEHQFSTKGLVSVKLVVQMVGFFFYRKDVGTTLKILHYLLNIILIPAQL